MDMESYIEHANKIFHLSLSDVQTQQFSVYKHLLMEWNQKFNLTAITVPEEIERKHFLDSMAISLAWKNNIPKKVIDIGTGAGFPGIVLKIIYPSIRLTLVESIGKKCEFLTAVLKELNISDVTLYQDRAELLGHDTDCREQFDCAVSRAVAPLRILSEYLIPFVTIGGTMIAMKGSKVEEEKKEAHMAIETLGAKLKDTISYLLPRDETPRSLVIVEKLKPTSLEYPRLPGIPAQLPL